MKQEMIKSIEGFGSDCLNRFGGIYQGGIRLQQNPDELADLIIFLQENKPYEIDYLEIGCASGGLTYIMDYFLDIRNIILIDDDLHYEHKRLKYVLKDVKYNKWVGNCHTAQATKFVSSLNLKFDVIFIDADHSYEGTKKDTIIYLPFLKEDGYMIFHDTEVPRTGVKSWLNDLPNSGLKIKNTANFINREYKLGIGVYQR